MSVDYEDILYYSRNPSNYGELEHPDVHCEDFNPLCGDRLAMDLQIEDNYVIAIRFQGRGCAISQAAASMLTEMVEGKSIPEVIALGKEHILEALGIPISPARTKCAFLSLRVLHGALALAGLEKPADDDDDL